MVDANVTVPTTLDGGHGGKNVVKGGGGPTREHGWFGHTVLVGGSGPNQLIGRKGVVRFRPSSTTTLAFARRTATAWQAFAGPSARAAPIIAIVHGRLVPVLSF